MHTMSLLHPFCYISVTAAHNVGNRMYVSVVGLDQTQQGPQAQYPTRSMLL
jgi:hypothetical protein